MATISDTGQVTIPEPIREALGLEPGSEVVFEYHGNGEVLIHKGGNKKGEEKPAATRFDRLQGSLKGKLTTDEILAMTRGED
ncbi:MAG TPA: type II toxin-antitoxin system PrlF family antitoxin [Rhizomicrobium sp.]|nr:type II toxin-antitoxin system PrlF family antitoxin [Rhizomicrobium sp.]